MKRAEEILAALKNGEEKAFKTFFSEYHDVLVLYATNILKDVDAAEDVVQDCFMNVWENSLYDNLSNGLDKYMFHLVKNAALNELRGSKRREARHEKMMAEMPVVEMMKEDEQTEIDILYTTINQLPPERRRIFMMVCAEGKKYQEVADQLQISINTVRTQLMRSLKFLREKLKEQMFSILLFCWKKVKIRF
ncbi:MULTISPECIES: RNA polymerase sigma-70 factor [Butyricimonas]|uniref:RNA polymerase sigma-70 factor n=1 Tax=Butyricimonas hominis TaxID=2763032 RepID=A0ABR7CXE6_9BACT|nr:MULTISPECIES: RNA polymerase sigma-70 factor [Butyricimonas]MBC5620357.1 RNA polymerase sigma-70 factor [Butyricimonas hominis]